MSISGGYDVLGVGNALRDRAVCVDPSFLLQHQLKEGSTVFYDDRSIIDATWYTAYRPEKGVPEPWTVGGSSANVIKTLAHLGHRCALVGKTGSDPYGDAIALHLQEIGVNISSLTRGQKRTGIANCFITSEERALQTDLGACVEFTENDLSAHQYENVKLVHQEGYAVYFGKVLETSLSLAQKNRCTISLDLAAESIVDQFKPSFKKAIPKVDCLFGNGLEMKALTGIENLKEAVEEFDSHQIVVATEGSKGCWVKWKGESDAVHHDAVQVPKALILDPTGAGDAFTGTVLDGVLKGMGAAETIRRASFVSSLVIQQIGTDLPKDQWKQLPHLLAKV